jgi:hypothetical protein
MDLTPKKIAKFALMGMALVFLADKLYVAFTEGRIRGRRRTYIADEDPFSFDVMVLLEAGVVVVILGMIVHGLWRAAVKGTRE